MRPPTSVIRRICALAPPCAALLLLALGPTGARADVTAVKGAAFGYQCTVMAFGQGCTPPTAIPSVTLATDATNSPQSATVATGRASSGPATIFSSGPITVSSQGALGAGGSVTSSTSIERVNASGDEPLTAASATSSCTASEAGVSATTTIAAGP